MQITPDSIVFWTWGPIVLNATIVYSWIAMAVLVVGSWLITRNLSTGTEVSRWQALLETVVSVIRNQIADITNYNPRQFLPFIGTLFLFISMSNLIDLIPVYQSPMGSLSTTVALAICVFISVPYYGIRFLGLKNYLKNYIKPSPIMLPFQIISEISRTFALAIRLFGNIMSGSMLVVILVSIVPLFLPIIMNAFGLLIGQIQAYIFAILAMVYIASGMRTAGETEEESS